MPHDDQPHVTGEAARRFRGNVLPPWIVESGLPGLAVLQSVDVNMDDDLIPVAGGAAIQIGGKCALSQQAQRISSPLRRSHFLSHWQRSR